MGRFAGGAQRFDPYKSFRFRVKWGGRYVAGVSKVSVLKRTTEIVKHRSGGDPATSFKSPARSNIDAITLERGVTHDPEFERWASTDGNSGSDIGSEAPLAGLRKDIIIEMRNEAGQTIVVYTFHRCRVSEYESLPDPDANANAIAIARLTIETEEWERSDR